MHRRIGSRARARVFGWPVVAGLAVWAVLGAPVAGRAQEKAAQENAAQETAAVGETSGQAASRLRSSVERDGLRISFAVDPLSGEERPLRQGETGALSFSITDLKTGQGVSSLYPAAWVDPLGDPGEDFDAACRERAGMYLRGMIGIRPLLDLNSYYVMVLNQDATISVIDPIIGVQGITKLYTQVLLPGPGADWVKSADEKTLYVAIPRAEAVAVVDLESFRLTGTIAVGPDPARLMIQPDGRYLWVGHAGEGGLSVVDLSAQKKVAAFPAGAGFHDMAASADSRFVVATNRAAGSATVIDVRKLETVTDVLLGGAPISVAYSPLSEAFYIAEGESGTVTVLRESDLRAGGDIATGERIQLAPGVGPTRISPDGRWGFATNASASVVHLFDTASNRELHRITVPGRPIQVSFSRSFAYIRTLETPRVAMLELAKITEEAPPPLAGFMAGEKAPNQVEDLSVADMISPAVGEAAVLAASPGDATVYYYMEGMNAPMGNFRNYGHAPRAVLVADRTIGETSPGRYVSVVKAPAAGEFMAILMLEAPEVIQCFAFTVEPDPSRPVDANALHVRFLDVDGHPVGDRRVAAGREMTVRVRFGAPLSDAAVTDLERVWVTSYRAPGFDRAQAQATAEGDGVYAVRFTAPRPGAYYLHLGATRAGGELPELPFLTLIATPPPAAAESSN